MSARDRKRGPGRRIGPGLEPLEARALLSVSGFVWRRAAQLDGAALVRAAEPRASAGLDVVSTPHERAFRPFVAKFLGPALVGPGRSPEVARQLYLKGDGTSTAFLRGGQQLLIEIPSDPSEGISGTAALFPQNYVATGSLLVLDLEGEPVPDPGTLPRALTWRVSDSSSGIFTDAEGEGVVEIDYGRAAGPRGRFGQGRAGVTFLGKVETVGIFDPRRLDIGGP